MLSLNPTRPQLKLKITRSVLDAIRDSIGTRPSEHGGMLGGTYENGITEFYFDNLARRSGASYSPDTDVVNRLLNEEWNPRNIRLLGFVHSHPPGIRNLSEGDLVYAEAILQKIPDLERLLLPLVISKSDTGIFEFLPFAVVRTAGGFLVEQLELMILEDTIVDAIPAIMDRYETGEVTPADKAINATVDQPTRVVANVQYGSLKYRVETPFSHNPARAARTFERVRGAYDLERLANSRIIYIGVGGAAAFAEDLARAGVGEHVLIDPDVVSETNIGTQQVYRRDIGKPKIDCVASRIADINPDTAITVCQNSLDDMSDSEFQLMALGPTHFRPKPDMTLICGLTDSFPAQSRVNRLALKFGLISMCAQVYAEGRGAEVTFTFPGVTPACHRCVLRSRYEAYLSRGFQNVVGSEGTPIFATTRLNALKGFVVLALLHHGTNHPRWGGLLGRIGNRNLIQIRMDPDLPLPVFGRVFGGGDSERIFFDDAVWLPQAHDCPMNGYPSCPDCGGTGDLRSAFGTQADTRVAPCSE